MILIADSGSTKTHWALLESDNKVSSFTTIGLNPHLTDRETFFSVLKNNFQIIKEHVSQIYFYGSGCASETQANFVKDILKDFFKHAANIQVQSDIIGAAIATLGDEEGYVAILGTGSVCAHYNGAEICKVSPSLGYMIGDDGSGAVMGKELLKTYFYGLLPKLLAESFSRQYDLRRETVLDNLYHKEQPNVYLASFTPFLKDHLHEESIASIVFDNLNAFFKHSVNTIIEEKKIQIAFVGSIAFHFNDILQDVAHTNKLLIHDIQKDPIISLSAYHQKRLL